MYLLIVEREEGAEAERSREEGGRQRDQYVSSHLCPSLGLNPQPSGVWDDAPAKGPTQPGRGTSFNPS